MRRLLPLIFLLFCCQNIVAQNNEKDSLNIIFSNIKSDSLLASTFKKKANYYRNRNSELHLFVIKKALSKAKKLKDEDQKADFKRELGIYYRKKGNLDSAIINYTNALEIYTNLKNSIKINIVKSSLANAYKAKGNFPKSIQYFNDVIAFFDNKDEKYQMKKLITQFNLSGVYINMLEWERADKLLESIYKNDFAQKNKNLIKAILH